MKPVITLVALLVSSTAALALPGERDRVYTADQNSNTISVIDPVSNTLLGQIRLGNARPRNFEPALQRRDQRPWPRLFAGSQNAHRSVNCNQFRDLHRHDYK